MWGISYWILPLFASCVWLAMLLAMLLHWVTQGEPHYVSMDPNQSIAYISDVGAQELKPLFIAMSAVTVVTLDVAFIAERWLRHRGRLTPNTSKIQKALSVVSIIAAIIGAAGIILLSIFDTVHYPHVHDAMLVVFIAGYIVSAICICAEYQRLGIHFRQHRILRMSFWIKLTFILVEFALAIAFGVTQNKSEWNAAAVLEWVIAFIFTFYVLSFFIDFIPAVRTKHHQSRETEVEMGMTDVQSTQPSAYYGNGTVDGATNGGYSNGHPTRQVDGRTNGWANHPNDRGINGDTYYPDGHPPKPTEPVPASRNF